MLTSLEILWTGPEEKTSFETNEIKRLLHDLLPFITLSFSIHHLQTCSAEFWKEKNEQKINILGTHLVWKEKSEQRMNILSTQLLLLPYVFYVFFFFISFSVNVTALHKQLFIKWAKKSLEGASENVISQK